jgi:3-oxoacyl-[acyl-carrier protein] reductase
MDPSSTSPKVVIYGATGGIGRALCAQLHASGAQLFLAARQAPALDELTALYAGSGRAICDAQNSSEVDAVMDAAKSHLGHIDAVVNLVGSLYLRPLHRTSDADFLKHLAINLHSAFYIVRAAVRCMERPRGGAIALVSTVAARFGLPNHEVIAAAKGGIIGLTLSAAASYAPANIRVNAVAPGLIETPLTQSLTGNPAMAQASAALHPLGRFGQPEDIATALAFLIDPKHAFITGQVWGVDGGMSRARPQVTAAARNA